MTNEEKQLLLIDLCARLPHGVKVHLVYDEDTEDIREMGLGSLHDIMFDNAEGKPYLRPMSSMTEEEKEEFRMLIFPEASCVYEDCLEWDVQIIGGGYLQIYVEDFSNVMDWLNANHFNYRLPPHLFIEAPEGMYKTE